MITTSLQRGNRRGKARVKASHPSTTITTIMILVQKGSQKAKVAKAARVVKTAKARANHHTKITRQCVSLEKGKARVSQCTKMSMMIIHQRGKVKERAKAKASRLTMTMMTLN